jgi:hypothetical protein
MKTNNKFKNSVFTLLFSDPALLRELYCALDGVTHRGAYVRLKPAYLYCTLLPLFAPEHVDFTRLHRFAVRLIVPA